MTYENQVAPFMTQWSRDAGDRRKGKTTPYTSTNGHMFSLVSTKTEELRLSAGPDGIGHFFAEHGAAISFDLASHGRTMRGYVLVPGGYGGRFLI